MGDGLDTRFAHTWQPPTSIDLLKTLTPATSKLCTGNVDGEAITGLASRNEGDTLGLAAYPPRQVILAQSDDLVVLAYSARRAIKELLATWSTLGIEHAHPENIWFIKYAAPTTLTAAILKEVEENRAFREKIETLQLINLHPFIGTEDTDAIAAALNLTVAVKSDVVEVVSDKNTVARELEKIGVETHPGILVSSLDAAEREIKQVLQTYAAVCIKLTRSASGQGVFKATSCEEALSIVKRYLMAGEKGLLIEPWLKLDKTRGCPSVQIYVGATPAEDIIFTATQQIMGGENGEVHLGNVNAPELLANHQLVHDIQVTMQWLRKNGFQGIAGIDLFAEESHARYRIGEINARHTGVTAAMAMVFKLTGKVADVHWAVNNNIPRPRTMSTRCALEILERKNLLYNHARGRGVVPTNLAAKKKVMAVMIGSSPEDLLALREELKILFI